MTSTVSTTMKGSAADVWAVLADGWLYPVWVVGASRMREVDDSWPDPGSRLHHSVGVWPLLINDTTSVVSSDPTHELVLQARAWPSGEAAVHITLEETSDGTTVTIAEDATHGPALLIPNPVRRSTLDLRNTETLRRLSYLVEHHARPAPR